MKKHKLFTIRVTFLRRGVEGVNLKFKKYSGIVNLTQNLTKKNQSESNQQYKKQEFPGIPVRGIMSKHIYLRGKDLFLNLCTDASPIWNEMYLK